MTLCSAIKPVTGSKSPLLLVKYYNSHFGVIRHLIKCCFNKDKFGISNLAKQILLQ